MNGNNRWNDFSWLKECEQKKSSLSPVSKKGRKRSHSKANSLNARRAVEDFILMKYYQNLHAEYSEA